MMVFLAFDLCKGIKSIFEVGSPTWVVLVPAVVG
jgi:hypothetical protein